MDYSKSRPYELQFFPFLSGYGESIKPSIDSVWVNRLIALFVKGDLEGELGSHFTVENLLNKR